MMTVVTLLEKSFGLLNVLLLVRIFGSWIISYNEWGKPPFVYLEVATRWYLEPFRRIIPTLGNIDVSPFVALFTLKLLQGFTVGLASTFLPA
jgi:YggT family protein